MMKKGLLVIVLCALGVFCVSNADAFTVKFETIDYFAWGTLYSADGTPQNVNPYTGVPTQNLSPVGDYIGTDGTEDAFGITQIQRIVSPDGLTVYWERSADQELTAFFYGADDVALGEPSGLLDKQDLLSNGFTVLMYLDDTVDYDPNLGTGGRTGLSSYTNVTDGELVLALTGHTQYLDLYSGTKLQPFTLEENGFPTTGTFSGSIFLDVSGGSWASLYDTNTWQPPFSDSLADFRFGFETHTSTGVGDWIIGDTSSAFGDVVPEPASMVLLGIGLAGAALRRRRKV